MADPLILEAGDVRATILPAEGGRVGSLIVDGRELLVTGDPDLKRWGSYPMVPFAGRIRDGRFSFRGASHQLPLGSPPHSIHGVVLDRPWRVEDAHTLSIDLDERWPYRGRVVQRFAMDEHEMTFQLTLQAADPMPATIGWHPWFRRVAGARRTPRRGRLRGGRDAGPRRVRHAQLVNACRRRRVPGMTRSPASTGTPPSSGRVACASPCPRAARGGSCTPSPSTRSAWSPRAGRRTRSTGRRRSSSPDRPSRTRCAGAGTAWADHRSPRHSCLGAHRRARAAAHILSSRAWELSSGCTHAASSRSRPARRIVPLRTGTRSASGA